MKTTSSTSNKLHFIIANEIFQNMPLSHAKILMMEMGDKNDFGNAGLGKFDFIVELSFNLLWIPIFDICIEMSEMRHKK